MSKNMVRRDQKEDFGKDLGLIHEVIVTGRKVSADREFWSLLAHHEDLFDDVVEFVRQKTSLLGSRISYEVSFNNKTILVELFRFFEELDANEMVTSLNEIDYRPLTEEELDCFLSEHSEVLKLCLRPCRLFQIVALGSISLYKGMETFAYCYPDGRKGCLHKSFISNHQHRIAATKK